MRDQVDHNVEVSWVFSSVKHDEKPKSGCTPTDIGSFIHVTAYYASLLGAWGAPIHAPGEIFARFKFRWTGIRVRTMRKCFFVFTNMCQVEVELKYVWLSQQLQPVVELPNLKFEGVPSEFEWRWWEFRTEHKWVSSWEASKALNTDTQYRLWILAEPYDHLVGAGGSLATLDFDTRSTHGTDFEFQQNHAIACTVIHWSMKHTTQWDKAKF